MKRAAILVLAIATLVLIVSPSAYSLAGSVNPTKSPTSAPSVIAPGSGITPGPSSTSGGGGGGTDQGDADGLSGLKVKPVTQTNFAMAASDRVSITMMMWWRLMFLIR